MPHAPDQQQVPRVSPQDVRIKMRASPGQVHLVCAYEDEDKCRQVQLAGAFSLKELEQRVEELEPDVELVSYCA